MGTALVILFLLAVSGLIAYSGDLLGRRIGKKRLTLFGLRPKQTAIVFTVGSGVIIAGVSLAAVAATSSAVRLALTRGEALIRKNAEYRRELRERVKQYAQSTQVLAAQKGELAAQKGELAAQRIQIDQLHRDEGALRGQNGALRSQNQVLGRQFERLKGAIQAIQEHNQALTASSARLAREAQAHRIKSHTLQQQVAGVRQEMLGASAELIALREEIEALRQSARRLATEEHIFAEGEQIARLIIPANPPASVLRRQIEGLVAAAQHEARMRGAGPDRQHAEAAYLEPFPLKAVALDGRKPAVDPVEVISLFAERVASAGDPVVLRAAATQNCLKGSPVPFVIQIGRNRLALQQGEELAASRIDGRQTEGEILEDLMSFLQKDVRRRADELGMIPGANREVGEMHYETLLEVVRKIRSIGAAAKVGAVAREKTWTGGQLKLDFYVVREDGDGTKR